MAAFIASPPAAPCSLPDFSRGDSSSRTHAPASTTSPVPPATTTPSTSGAAYHSRHAAGLRRESLPFVFPTPFQSNASSTSLVPSTAEGRPIPLDNSTAAHRTSALRELNRSQPSSRHRYTRSTGAPPSVNSTTTGTYSQPVLVRTYSGPPPSSSSSTRPPSRRAPLSSISITSSVTNWRPGRNGMVVNMARSVKGKKKQHNPKQAFDDAKLPPLEAFTFKSIMTEMQQDIGADLDRIAEICARSRYSLSNQYEVHVAPHGSGQSFVNSSKASKRPANVGPTLQAITSDDEHSSSTRHRRRRGTQRRRSAAQGTLETIMSSSRSSDEDKSKKKSAAELAEGVRGRASTHSSQSSGTAEDGSGSTVPLSEEASEEQRRLMRRKSSSFAAAVMDNTKNSQTATDATTPRSSGTALVSEPAKPKTSRNHLEIRTSESSGTNPIVHNETPQRGTHETTPAQPSQAVVSASMASAAIASPDGPYGGDANGRSGLFSAFSTWMPWKTYAGASSTSGPAITEVAKSDHKAGARSKSYAEGTLRELLKTAEPTAESQVAYQKGKSVEHGH